MRRVAPKGPSRRLGVIDGSQMGDHYLVAALLCGKVNYPVLVESCKGRGHELKTTQHLLPIAHQLLGSAAPQLWLMDAHYFNQSSFQTVCDQQAHLLIKYSPHDDDEDTKLFRDVLEDAKALFAVNTDRLKRFPGRIKAISRDMGHSSVKITLDTYLSDEWTWEDEQVAAEGV